MHRKTLGFDYQPQGNFSVISDYFRVSVYVFSDLSSCEKTIENKKHSPEDKIDKLI
jgi:hypothetical protein